MRKKIQQKYGIILEKYYLCKSGTRENGKFEILYLSQISQTPRDRGTTSHSAQPDEVHRHHSKILLMDYVKKEPYRGSIGPYRAQKRGL